MAELNFPSSPTPGQEHQENDRTWTWDGTSWVAYISTDSDARLVDHTQIDVIAGTGLSGGGSIDADLTLNISNTGVSANTYGSASKIAVLTVNAQGQLTTVTEADVAGVSGFTFDSATGKLNISTADGSNYGAFATLDPYSTSTLTEGSNLYYTTARANSAIDTRVNKAFVDALNVDADTLDNQDGTYYLNYANFTGTPPSTYDSSDFAVNFANQTTSGLTEGTNLYYTTARANTDFDTRLGTKSTTDLSEGTNLYYTTTRVNSAFDTRLGTKSTSDLSEGTNLYYTAGRSDSDARNAINVADQGGDGSLSYNPTTGQITYTGPSASEVRAHFSQGTGVTIASGQISIGQAVGTGDNVTFNTVQADLTGDVTGTVSSLSNHSTTNLSEGTNQYFTNARARSAISVTDAGGDGSLSYSSGTGVITYTGPSASEVRAHFSGGTGVTITNGSVAIGQAVGTSDTVEFGGVTVNGNLTVNGTTTTINTTELVVSDNTITLNNDVTGTPTENSGIIVERGTSSNVDLLWNETTDKWTVGAQTFVAATFEGDLTGNVTGTVSDISNHSTSDLSEGSNLYHTTARARSAISVTDAGGDGSLSYSSGTGVITYTGPSASEVRAHISATGDVSYSSATGIISFSETYSSAAELLTAIKTVDGATSGLDADLLDGQEGSYYRLDVYDNTGALLN